MYLLAFPLPEASRGLPGPPPKRRRGRRKPGRRRPTPRRGPQPRAAKSRKCTATPYGRQTWPRPRLGD
eukprot:3116015-Lingulodinium_polyedra.AAC.1